MKKIAQTSPCQVSRAVGLIIACLFMTAPPCAAFAQTGVLEEVTVTARKREELLQDTPIAIAAFSATDIDSRGLAGVAEIGYATPNVIIDGGAAASGSNSATTMFIRGIGQTDFTLSVDPGVGFYVDGVYYGQQVGTNVDFLGIDRIEVLKGPQGTLFGRNTMGGAVNIVTRRPSREQQGTVKVTLGSDRQADFAGSVDLPLGDRLFSKISAATRSRDGYVTRLSTGEKLGDDHRTSARGTLLWEATNSLKLTLDADLTRTREGVSPDVLIAVNPAAPIPAYYNAVTGGAACRAPTAPTDPRCYNSQWVFASGDAEAGTLRSASSLDLWGFALTADYSGTVADIKSITAYRRFTSFFSLDNDHSPLKVVEFTSDFASRQFTQEFQFTGSLFDERMKWLGGLYYYDERSHDRNPIDFSIGSLEVGGDLDVRSYAGFGQATYSVTDKLDVTAGIRYTDEKKVRDPRSFLITDLVLGPTRIVPAGTDLVPRGDATIQAAATTTHLNVAYHWTDGVMTYATYSEGFKGGGFTDRVSFPVPAVPTFEPEDAESIEIGLKSTLFDKRLTANLAAFDVDYRNIQVFVASGIAPTIQNAAEGRIRGIEFDAQALLAPGLVVAAGAGYIDAKYTSIDPRATEITLNRKFPKTPKTSFNASVSYELLLAQGARITPRVDWYRRSEVFNDALNAPLARQDAYDLLNASLTYNNRSDNWRVSLVGKNLTDQQYLLNAKSNGSQGFVSGTYARPRQWSIVVQADF